MNKKSMMKIALGVFFLMLFCSFGVSAQKTDCTKTTDEDVVKAVYDNLKVKYENQLIHINVISKDGVVTLQGWVTTKGVRKDIEKIVKKTSCVKKVTNKLTIGVGGGCGAGTKPCGDICIPSEDPCNISKGKG